MKFAYVDESGDTSQSDVFVMGGLVVDHHRLRKKTEEFNILLRELFKRHPGSPKELKTKAFMRGSGGWNAVPGDERKAFLRSVCELAVDKGDKIYAIAVSLSKCGRKKEVFPFEASHWVASGMFVACLIQKKMQSVSGKKGITAFVVDDNKAEMPKLSDAIYTPSPWFDGLYQAKATKRGKQIWVPRTHGDRLDHIVNTAFAIKSEHSSLVQVADAFCWAYRRALELVACNEEFDGEKEYYESLRKLLDEARICIGSGMPCDARDWYKAISHDDWKL